MYYPEYKIAFVAINKTGSSSVLTALNEALYTPDVPEIWQRIPFHARRRVYEDLKHAQAYFYFHILGKEEYSNCFVFSQVRNPFDKVVSDFIFRCRAPKNADVWKRQRTWFIDQGLMNPTNNPGKDLFSLYVEALASGDQTPHSHWRDISNRYDMPDSQKSFINQIDGLTDLEGKIMVDEVYRLEDLPKHWCNLQDIIRVKTGKRLGRLPHVNESRRDEYKEYYDDKTYKIVSDLFKEDIEYFDYSF